jgi:3-phosphoshikimate 1-carboxyvinyltransferase
MKQAVVSKKSSSFSFDIDSIAPDKSISHRCAMFSILSDEVSIIRNFLEAEDTLNSLHIVQSLGASISRDGNTLKITPPKKPQIPDNVLDCGNSGTSIRLFCGLFSSLDGYFVLTGDKYLRRRPMRRVTKPLIDIGAKIYGRDDSNLAPLTIMGGELKSFNYTSKIASAQVKSAMILAALRADGISTYIEPELTRDHTERMLKGMGVNLVSENLKTTIEPIKKPLKPLDITVPSDPSSGFFFAVAAAITKDSHITLKNISLNPTRIEAYQVLKRMGVDITFVEKENLYEPIGDIVVKHKELKAVEVSENISWLIDELPALSIAFSLAKGTSVVKNASELRVKESDRIKSVVDNLNKCGVETREFEDGYEVIGSSIHSAKIDSFGDHRIAMSFAIAGLVDGMQIDDIDCIDTSFPNFFEILSQITEVKFAD